MAGSHAGLFSPVWCPPLDDDAFAEVASHDEDIDRAEFEHLTGADRPGSYLFAPATAPHEETEQETEPGRVRKER